MSKKLVAYFSASGVTKSTAERLAKAADADLFEIQPLVPYTVFHGFPIWWYVAPAIINTFVESYDFSGKTVVPFATSGGSGMGKTEETLRTLCPNAIWKKGEMLNHVSDTELKKWLDDIL